MFYEDNLEESQETQSTQSLFIRFSEKDVALQSRDKNHIST